MEAERLLQVKRGNIQQELALIGEVTSEGTEVQTLTLFKLMKTFEKVMLRVQERENKPQHVVFQYNYTMEEARDHMLERARQEKTLPFGGIFDHCRDRMQAIFLFLSLLELIQQNYLRILTGEGRNNFIIEYEGEPEEREPEEED
jgi:segregation and condensation protein A